MKVRDALRFSLPYLTSFIVIVAVFVIEDSYIENMSTKVLSVFQKDTERIAETIALMVVEGSRTGAFVQVTETGSDVIVFEPADALSSALLLEYATVVLPAAGSSLQSSDSLEALALESGAAVSGFESSDQEGTGFFRAVYPVLDQEGAVTALSSVSRAEPYSIRWLTTLRYAIMVMLIVVVVLVILPRMLFDFSEVRRQRELDEFDQTGDDPRYSSRGSSLSHDLLLTTLQSLDTSSCVASVLLSGEGEILFMSNAAQNLFDISFNDCRAFSFWQLPVFPSGERESIRESMATPGMDITLRYASGGEAIVSLSRFDVSEDPDRLILVVATESGRERDLQREKVTRSIPSKPLAGSVAVISAMIRGFMHELNNIIGGIIGASSVGVQAHEGSSPDRERYVSIIDEARRASNIISELLQTTTPRMGEDSNRIDIRHELSEIYEALRGVLPRSTPVKFECGTNALIEAPGIILRQLVYSLAIGSGNKRTGSVGFSISVDDITESRAVALFGAQVKNHPSSGYVCVSLSDGTKIPPDVQRMLQNPDTDPGDVQDAFGASLATAVQAVQNLGGRIAFSSSSGETRMHLLLRSIPGIPTAPFEQFSSDGSIAGLSVLIAEDVDMIRESIKEMLTHLGFDTVAVSTGNKALEMLEKRPYDVLMLDLTMPGMSSLEVAGIVRESWPEVAVIITSGYDMDEELEKLVSLPGISFLAKPYLPGNVASRIVEAAQEMHRTRSGTRGQEPRE
jgi:CheY-like chemotaxis protein